MNIRLLDGGGVLDLKTDFKLSMTVNNPMLTEQGSMSLPITIPETANNSRLLGMLNLQSHYKPKRNHSAIIEAGIYQKPALLRLNEKERDSEAVLYLNESPMYARMKETDMLQAFDITRPASDFFVSGTFDSDLDMMIKYMELVMVGNIEEDFYLFPVATDNYDQTYQDDPLNPNGTFTFYQVLNEQCSFVVSSLSQIDPLIDTDLNGITYYRLAGREPRKYYNKNEFEDVPKGYGITPFLKQTFILHRIFNYFGYELEESIFDTDPQFQKIAVLNNTADAIVNTNLKYSQLVPSVKISDYLQSVCTDYGCEFFISTDLKTVKVIFWNDLLSNTDYHLLDNKLSGRYKLELSDELLLKLTCKRSIDFSNTNFDTLEKFISEYGDLMYISSIPSSGISMPDGLYFIQKYGQIWEKKGNTGVVSDDWKYHSQYLFDYYLAKENIDEDYDTKESNREYVAYVPAYVRYTYKAQVYFFPGEVWNMPYIGSRRHLNSQILVTVTNGDYTTSTLEEESNSVSCPITTAFYKGRYNGTPNVTDDPRNVFGSIYLWDQSGNPDGTFDLIFGGLNGLYSKFWSKYAAVIRDSFNIVKLPLHFDLTDIQNFRFDNIYMIDNQPLLPEKLSFSIDRNNKVTVSEAQFRTTKLYL